MYSAKVRGAKLLKLLLETELADQGAVGALVGLLQVQEMLAAIRYEAQKPTTRVLILAVLVEVR